MEHNYNRPTPAWLMNIFEDWFDPCPLNPDPMFNGLDLTWPERTYCNPPYNDIKSWTDKALDNPYMTVMLLPADVSTHWFMDLHTSKRTHFFLSHGRRLYPNCRGNLLVFIEQR